MSKLTTWIKLLGKSEPAVIVGSALTVLLAVKQGIDTSPTPVTWSTLLPLITSIAVRFVVVSPNTHAARVRSAVAKATVPKTTKKTVAKKTTAKKK